MKTVLVFLLFIFSALSWSKDLTPAYLSGKSELNANQLRALSQYKVLIIPGVLAQSFIADSDNQLKLTFLFEDGFKEQITLMQRLNVEYQFVNLETENPPIKNAINIIEAIEQSDKPVLIYSHSKGGLDTLEAIRQKPELLAKIHGWASIQSPFWGAPVASGMNDNKFFRDTGDSLFKWMGGDAAGMSSLTIEERMPYMESKEIKDLLITINKKIQFINFASFKTNTFGVDTPLELFRNYTDNKAGKNDGVVPLTSALMKEHGLDVNFVLESEVDHLMTMTRYRLNSVNYSQQNHTLSILKLLL